MGVVGDAATRAAFGIQFHLTTVTHCGRIIKLSILKAPLSASKGLRYGSFGGRSLGAYPSFHVLSRVLLFATSDADLCVCKWFSYLSASL
jgi:hypothetical protein